MITQKQYLKHKEEWWLGKRVRLLRDLKSGANVIPKGKIMEIERKYSGFSLVSLDICGHCKIGVKVWITRIPPYALELIELDIIRRETDPAKLYELKLELFEMLCKNDGRVDEGSKFDCFDPGGMSEDDYFELQVFFEIAKKHLKKGD